MKRRGSEVTAGFLQVNPHPLPADNSFQSVVYFVTSVAASLASVAQCIRLSLLVRESLVCSLLPEDCERFIFNLGSRLCSLKGGRRRQEKARKRFPVLLHFSKLKGSTFPPPPPLLPPPPPPPTPPPHPPPTTPPPPATPPPTLKHNQKTASKSSPKALVSLAQSLSPSLV